MNKLKGYIYAFYYIFLKNILDWFLHPKESYKSWQEWRRMTPQQRLINKFYGALSGVIVHMIIKEIEEEAKCE